MDLILGILGTLCGLILTPIGIWGFYLCFTQNSNFGGMIGAFCLGMGLAFLCHIFLLLPQKTQNHIIYWLRHN